MTALRADVSVGGVDLDSWLCAYRMDRHSSLVIVADLTAIFATWSLEELILVLDSEERLRCSRFRFLRDQMRYAASHALLRASLGILLGRQPKEVLFESGRAHFRPLRLQSKGADSVQGISLSHAGDFVAIAVSRALEVGIDVESLRALTEVDGLISVMCNPEEQREMQAFCGLARAHRILRAWTAKEAVLKAMGVGLAVPPQNARVAYGPDGAPSVVRVVFAEGNVRLLHVHSFDAFNGKAIVAVAAVRDSAIKCAWGDAVTLLQRVRSNSGTRFRNRPIKRKVAERLRKKVDALP